MSSCPIRFRTIKKKKEAVIAPPTLVQEFCVSPVKLITRTIWHIFNGLEPFPPPQNTDAPIRVVCISDTHNRITSIPVGDVLIHAGDLTNTGTVDELRRQIDWLDSIPGFTAKYVIGGNCDIWLDFECRPVLYPEDDSETDSSEENSSVEWDDVEGDENDTCGHMSWERDPELADFDWKSIKYLQDDLIRTSIKKRVENTETVNERELMVMGRPERQCYGKKPAAFGYTPSQDDDIWRSSAGNADILITHMPPQFYLDLGRGFKHLGSKGLNQELWRLQPKLHVFGHIHRCRGTMVLRWDAGQRAFERASQNGPLGGYDEFFSPSAWWDLLIVIVFGLWAMIQLSFRWDRNVRKTIMINAALFYGDNGKLASPIHVIHL